MAEGDESRMGVRGTGGVDHEVAIVGAGAVGITTAYDLARRGVDVTVYERDAVASGASGRAAGVCYDAFASRPDATLGREAIERFREFAAEGAPFTPCPYVWLAREGDEERIRLLREGIDRMRDLGGNAVELDATELTARFPALRGSDVAIAGLTTTAGFTDPGAYTAWLAAQARAEGVSIREQTPVAVATDPLGVCPGAGTTAEQSRGQEPDALVVAAGARSKQLLADAGVSIPMKPYRVQALVGAVPDEWLTQVASSGADEPPDSVAQSSGTDELSDWGPMWYDASADCYARPHPDGLLAGNGTESVEADPGGYDRDADDGFAADLAARVQHRVPGCALDVRRAWAGLCTATPDRDPLVGQLRKGVYVATGFQGQGFMRAPAVGRRLADEILGGEGIAAFDPTRFDGDEAFTVREGMAVEP